MAGMINDPVTHESAPSCAPSDPVASTAAAVVAAAVAAVAAAAEPLSTAAARDSGPAAPGPATAADSAPARDPGSAVPVPGPAAAPTDFAKPLPPKEKSKARPPPPTPEVIDLAEFSPPCTSVPSPTSIMHQWPLLQWGRCVISFKHSPLLTSPPVPLAFQPYPKGSALEREHLERCAQIEARIAAAAAKSASSAPPQPEERPDEQPSIYNLINGMNYEQISDQFEPWIQRKCRGKKIPCLGKEQLAVPSVVIEVPADMQDQFDHLTIKMNRVFSDVLQQDLTAEERKNAIENLHELAQRIYLIELFPEMTWVVFQINTFHRKAAQYAFAAAVDVARRRVIEQDPSVERLARAASMTVALAVRCTTTMAEEAKNNNAERRRQSRMDLGEFVPRQPTKRSASGTSGEQEQAKRPRTAPVWQQIVAAKDRSVTWRQVPPLTTRYVSRLNPRPRHRRHRRRGKKRSAPRQQPEARGSQAMTETQATAETSSSQATQATTKEGSSRATQAAPKTSSFQATQAAPKTSSSQATQAAAKKSKPRTTPETHVVPKKSKSQATTEPGLTGSDPQATNEPRVISQSKQSNAPQNSAVSVIIKREPRAPNTSAPVKQEPREQDTGGVVSGCQIKQEAVSLDRREQGEQERQRGPGPSDRKQQIDCRLFPSPAIKRERAVKPLLCCVKQEESSQVLPDLPSPTKASGDNARKRLDARRRFRLNRVYGIY